jgi:hypothetical protein
LKKRRAREEELREGEGGGTRVIVIVGRMRKNKEEEEKVRLMMISRKLSSCFFFFLLLSFSISILFQTYLRRRDGVRSTWLIGSQTVPLISKHNNIVVGSVTFPVGALPIGRS